MYKRKSASMQNGALHRDPADRITREEYVQQSAIVLSSTEIAHFEFGTVSLTSMVEAMRPRITLMARNGFRKPRDVSRLLNKDGVRTACGEKWNPRLAAFLLKFIYEGPPSQSDLRQVRLKEAAPPVVKVRRPPRVKKPPIKLGGLSRREQQYGAPRPKSAKKAGTPSNGK
ncbi:MAG: hypothetical protein ACU0B1_01000 [Thermohalobaculum sp.]